MTGAASLDAGGAAATASDATPNPLQQQETAGGPGGATDGGAARAPDTQARGQAATEDGRVNIKDLLLDSQAHRGTNRMLVTLAMVYVGFKFLGQLTDDRFAKNNVQLRNWGLPRTDDIKDAVSTAEFARTFYSSESWPTRSSTGTTACCLRTSGWTPGPDSGPVMTACTRTQSVSSAACGPIGAGKFVATIHPRAARQSH
eukprot:SAG31_NODE_956_length_10790_cov_34.583107_5_plen_201_part_00